ncbi:hypothetical protein GCM10010385_67090 [Streptomyces geysiriensis]|nr:hypothetical protein GCM10010385_67090 [Streptomyces geysiriensis]
MSTENLPQSPEQSPEQPPRKPRVAVVFGGRSSEHGISVVTAGAVLGAIDRTKYDVLPIGITRDGRWALTADEPERMAITDRRTPDVDELAESTEGGVVLPVDPANREVVYSEPGSVPKALGEVDVVFPVLHGPYGEDGTLQGLLELSGVPYVGSGVLASAVGQDKEYMKAVFTSYGLKVGPYVVIRPREWEQDRSGARAKIVDFAGEHGWPLFVKPARAGSSIGITKVDDLAGLDEAIEEARRHDPKILVEAALRGREIECGVLEFEDGPRASVPAEIPPPSEHAYYDFEAKYIDSTPGIVPAPLTDEQTAEVRRLAVEAFDAASCEGLVRADFFLTEDDEFVINEINTMPGFTPISMYPQMWQATGVGYPGGGAGRARAPRRRPGGLRCRSRPRPPRRRPPRGPPSRSMISGFPSPPPAGGSVRSAFRHNSVTDAPGPGSAGTAADSPSSAEGQPATEIDRRDRAGEGLEMNDRTGQGAGDAVHLLDLGDHHATQLVDGVGLGADDDVIGSCHVLGLDHSRDLADRLGDGRRLADLRLDQDVRLYHGTSRAATRIMWGKGTPRYRVAAPRGETRGGRAVRAGVPR